MKDDKLLEDSDRTNINSFSLRSLAMIAANRMKRILNVVKRIISGVQKVILHLNVRHLF